MTSKFREGLAIGTKSELAVSFVFQQHGFFLIPLAKLPVTPQGGPRAWNFGTAIILPDLAAVGFGQLLPLEVKGKTEPTFYRKEQTWEHGIDLRHFNHYRAFALASGLSLVLVIDEGKHGEILAASLKRLGEPRVYDGETGHPPMVYWRRDHFTVFAQGEPNDLPLFRGHPVPPTLPRSGDLSE
jgi:hypothetical protein